MKAAGFSSNAVVSGVLGSAGVVTACSKTASTKVLNISYCYIGNRNTGATGNADVEPTLKFAAVLGAGKTAACS